MKKVLITPKSFSQAGLEPYKLLHDAGFEVIENKTGKTLDENQLIEQCSDVDGVIIGVDPMTKAVIKNAKKLKAISKYGAGLDNIDLTAASEYRIKVERAAGTNAISVAELAIGLFFSLARSIPQTYCITKSCKWDRIRGAELGGKTAGIAGYGNIGREVARMAHGIGMKVLVYDPFVKAGDESLHKYSAELVELEEVFEKADFLSLHVPLNDETRHMINKKTLALMKKSSYLINTSRGELVDEDALYEALVNGDISGAAEDVFSREPPGEHRLLKLDNFILTSHVGGFTQEAIEKMAVQSAMNIIRLLNEKD